jgi:hypothetical protein
MAAQGKPTARKRRRRRTTGHDALTTIRLSSELRERVDAWAAKQRDKPVRFALRNCQIAQVSGFWAVLADVGECRT